MTLTLDLPADLEQYLIQEAQQQGLSVETVTLQLLTSSIILKQRQVDTVNLLQSWIDDDDTEDQQETGQYLFQSLDADRLANRPLFPTELQGITW
ncbi:MAG: hypothetical protein AAF579_10300 [Cyanobacteria bacterium P01_C01_bin.118]